MRRGHLWRGVQVRSWIVLSQSRHGRRHRAPCCLGSPAGGSPKHCSTIHCLYGGAKHLNTKGGTDGGLLAEGGPAAARIACAGPNHTQHRRPCTRPAQPPKRPVGQNQYAEATHRAVLVYTSRAAATNDRCAGSNKQTCRPTHRVWRVIPSKKGAPSVEGRAGPEEGRKTLAGCGKKHCARAGKDPAIPQAPPVASAWQAQASASATVVCASALRSVRSRSAHPPPCPSPSHHVRGSFGHSCWLMRCCPSPP